MWILWYNSKNERFFREGFWNSCLEWPWSYVSAFFHLLKPVQAEDFSVPAKHAIAVDVPSGKILYEQDAQTPAPVGSITTLLTVYLVYEAIEEGKLSLNSPVDIGDYPIV